MIRRAVSSWMLAIAIAGPATAAERPDLLRFTNGDQLHGTFLGITDGPQAVWKRDDIGAPVEFKTTQIRHIVLRGGRPLAPLESLSYVGLVNGDRIPGSITAMDGGHVTVETGCAGTLRIPRPQVAMVAPNPLGGRVCYYGPFSPDDWSMAHPSFPDGLPPADTGAEEKSDTPGRWVFSGAAWYWQNKQAGTTLIRKTGMPDRAVLRFDLAWKNRLSVAVAFHADFARTTPPAEGEEKQAKVRAFVPGDATDLPRLFGNSYVLQMYSNYLMLYRTSVSEEGHGSIDRVQLNNNNLRLGDAGHARVEIRSNRLTGAISLFVNDEFLAQWSEGGRDDGDDAKSYAGKGEGFGFVVQGDDTPVRISDIVVSEWNGMPDSARSMQVDEQDVVLMTNGTDRYAGRITGLDAQGRVLFEGKHGKFHFPFQDVAEIRFARGQLAPETDAPADSLVVRLNPIGSISGRPVSGDATTLELLSAIAGPIQLSLNSAVMLDFNSSNQTIDDWDADF